MQRRCKDETYDNLCIRENLKIKGDAIIEGTSVFNSDIEVRGEIDAEDVYGSVFESSYGITTQATGARQYFRFGASGTWPIINCYPFRFEVLGFILYGDNETNTTDWASGDITFKIWVSPFGPSADEVSESFTRTDSRWFVATTNPDGSPFGGFSGRCASVLLNNSIFIDANTAYALSIEGGVWTSGPEWSAKLIVRRVK